MQTSLPTSTKALKGTRILSLALNIPGPAALMRLHHMGAHCTKLEPPAAQGAPKGTSSDPLGLYNPNAYADLHHGITVTTADLKTDGGQAKIHRLLAKTDILLTSFRPSALIKLGLHWPKLRKHYPGLSLVSIVGAPGVRAEEPGHDLTYLAESGLVQGLTLPPTLYADMGGSLMASEAVLQARLQQLQSKHKKGIYLEVALSDAAHYLALPHHWGLTKPGASVGGGHAGYQLYACKDGRVALAALEPHFSKALMQAVGLAETGIHAMHAASTQKAVAAFIKKRTRKELEALGAERDIPLYTMN